MMAEDVPHRVRIGAMEMILRSRLPGIFAILIAMAALPATSCTARDRVRRPPDVPVSGSLSEGDILVVTGTWTVVDSSTRKIVEERSFVGYKSVVDDAARIDFYQNGELQVLESALGDQFWSAHRESDGSFQRSEESSSGSSAAITFGVGARLFSWIDAAHETSTADWMRAQPPQVVDGVETLRISIPSISSDASVEANAWVDPSSFLLLRMDDGGAQMQVDYSSITYLPGRELDRVFRDPLPAGSDPESTLVRSLGAAALASFSEFEIYDVSESETPRSYEYRRVTRDREYETSTGMTNTLQIFRVQWGEIQIEQRPASGYIPENEFGRMMGKTFFVDIDGREAEADVDGPDATLDLYLDETWVRITAPDLETAVSVAGQLTLVNPN